MGTTRCLGIDYGEKRIGLSFGDDLGLASPLPAAVERTKEERLQHIGRIIRERRVTILIMGYPLNMNGTVGPKAKEVEVFAKVLEERFQLPVHLADERLTSFEAEANLKSRKRKVTRASGEVDSIAATLILQDYLTHKFPVIELDAWDDEDNWGDED